ncbi:hypothetical protein PILCRDRAFT_813744 [Piloderma croceum F 1598]|uniref:Uncharacterized protein n=1 Tax=Piloderma croceum (strain F 1598) TaxID=765440 RepID=A0A0C3GAJ7_PILCF|nr:hypothetical protein PILCRDRAFT_813744 [Piloderma croceum F 1598]
MNNGSESPVYCVTMSYFLICDVQSQEQHHLSGCVEPAEVAAPVVGFETQNLF